MSSKIHPTFSFLALTRLSFKFSIVVKHNVNFPIIRVIANSKSYSPNHKTLWNCSFQCFSETFIPFLTFCYLRPVALLKTLQRPVWCLHRLSTQQMFTVKSEWMNEWMIFLFPNISYDALLFFFFNVLKPYIFSTVIK